MFDEKKQMERIVRTREEWAENDRRRDEDLKEPETLVKVKDIVYSTVDGEDLRLDVYYPEGTEGLLPVIVNSHGGGYFYGDKELYRFYCMNLAERGFTVVNYTYRLAPEHKFPAAIEDTHAAYCWVGENIKKYHGDPEKVMGIGDSAGAQIASEYGVLYSNPDFAVLYGIKMPGTFKLRAVSVACGLYDMIERANSERGEDFIHDYLGEDFDLSDPRVDVLRFVNSNYPPAYVFSCKNDFLMEKVEPFANLLKSKGVYTESKIYTREDGSDLYHVFHVNLHEAPGQLANDEQADFFRRILAM